MATAVASGRWPCACDRQRRLEERHPRLKQKRPWHWEARNGCNGKDGPAPIGYFEGKPLMRCPARLVPPWCWEYLRIHDAWSKGRPIGATMLAEESALLLAVMATIDGTIADLRREKRERKPASGGSMPGGVQAISPVTPSAGPRKRRRRRA